MSTPFERLFQLYAESKQDAKKERFIAQQPTRYEAGYQKAINGKRSCLKRGYGDFASAASMGLVGGFMLHFLKTVYFSPPGAQRWFDALKAAAIGGPRTAWAFGLWGGIFSFSECHLKRARGKKDAFTSIVAGAATGGVLALRDGAGGMARGALIGGMLLGVIEGIIHLVTMVAGDDKEAEKTVEEMSMRDINAADLLESMYYWKHYKHLIDTDGRTPDGELLGYLDYAKDEFGADSAAGQSLFRQRMQNAAVEASGIRRAAVSAFGSEPSAAQIAGGGVRNATGRLAALMDAEAAKVAMLGAAAGLEGDFTNIVVRRRADVPEPEEEEPNYNREATLDDINALLPTGTVPVYGTEIDPEEFQEAYGHAPPVVALEYDDEAGGDVEETEEKMRISWAQRKQRAVERIRQEARAQDETFNSFNETDWHSRSKSGGSSSGTPAAKKSWW